MKKIGVFAFMVIFLLTGCSKPIFNPIEGNASIEWSDFLKLNGQSYTGLRNAVIKDPNDITDEVVGNVAFKVADVVTNPNYRTKDGDAGYLSIGTELYRVKGFSESELIAAKDERRIGSYRLYTEDHSEQSLELPYHDIPKGEVNRIELFHSGETTPFQTLTDLEKETFLRLLEAGTDSMSFSPNTEDGEQTYYSMVFFTDHPIAYSYSLIDDGEHVYFRPSRIRVLDQEIRTFLHDGDEAAK